MKAMKHLFALLALSTAATFAWAGCSADTGDESAEGDEDAITATKCKVIDARDGHAMTAAELKKLNDPIAAKIIGGAKGKCPTSFQDSVAKLGETDNKNCQSSGGGPIGPLPPFKKPPPGAQFALGPKSAEGNSVRFVSDRSQVLGKPDSYRAVVTRECNGRTDHEMFISLFGIQAGDEDLPSDFEAIGKDKTSGVFNYYAREDGAWKFFGNSLDLIGDGYDCKDNGACTPKAAVKTRCASCHIGGGLNMKELQSPWVNWEGDTTTPGTDDLVTKHKALLGTKGNGIDMESKTRGGNAEYTPKRVAFLKTKGVEELLRPLFCTLDIQLQSANSVSFFSLASVVTDPNFGGNDGPDFTDADYDALKKQFNQRIVDARGTQLKGPDGKPVTDTFFKFTFPTRGDLDFQYVNELVTEKIIDDDFKFDVLNVDFTRGIFSGQRCGLLKFAPKLAADKLDPDAIRNGFIENLKSATDPAAKKLLANLQKKDDQAAHQQEVDAFWKACKKRPAKDVLSDLMTFASHQRRAARANTSRREGQGGQGIIEFAETLPVDDIPDTNKAFDPATCTLK
jgi:hypothetical protein